MSLIVPSKTVSVLDVVVVKSGWLTKQGGARGGRKNWKRRWFVLKDEVLYYYKDEKQAALLGLIPLKGTSLLDYAGDQEQTPPEWEETKYCYECKVEFGVRPRQHHCRHCGKAFCDKCSSRQIPIPKFAYNTPVRVCDVCFKELSTELAGSRYNIKVSDADDCSESGYEAQGVLSPNGTKGIRTATVSELHKVRTPKYRHKFTLPTEMKPNLFALKSLERELWLQADDADERESWVSHIHSVQKNMKNPMPLEDVPRRNQWEIDYKEVTILGRVGGGAFGDVHRARLWGTDIAVKTLKTENVSNDGVLNDIKKEIEILSQLRHPNVILYIGAWTKPPNVCIYTEWCEQGSLFKVLHDHSIHINAKTIINIAIGIAQGMNYLHSLENKIIHRDLKSHNILVDRNFTVKVADFGLSHIRTKVKGPSRDERARDESAASLADAANAPPRQSIALEGIIGTPEWMAPEMMEGQTYNEKVDVYSYGILLTELVTRQMPFHDTYNVHNYLDIVDAVLEDGAIPTIPQWCDGFLKPLIIQCLDRMPSQRPSFTDIIMKLRQFSNLDDSVYFFQFDVPRLREQMMSRDASVQAMAASEIASLIATGKIQRNSAVDEDRFAKGLPGLMIPTRRHNSFLANQVNGRKPRPSMVHVVPGAAETTQQFWRLDDDDAAAFLDRFTALLSSSSESVQLNACKAIANLLGVADRQKRAQDRRSLLSQGALSPLVRLLSSSNRLISDQAGRVMLELTSNVPTYELNAFSGLAEEGLKKLDAMLDEEVVELERRYAETEKVLAQRREVRQSLQPFWDKGAQSGADREKTSDIRKPKFNRGRPTKRPSKSPFKFNGLSPSASVGDGEGRDMTELDLTSTSDQSTSDMPGMPRIMSAGPILQSIAYSNHSPMPDVPVPTSPPPLPPIAQTPKSPGFIANPGSPRFLDGVLRTGSTAITPLSLDGDAGGGGTSAPKPSVLASIVSNTPGQKLSSAEDVKNIHIKVSKIVNLYERKHDPAVSDKENDIKTSLMRIIPTPEPRMPPRFRNTFTFVRHFGHVLRYDEDAQSWQLAYLVLGATELRVFPAPAEDPDDPSHIIRVKTKHGLPTKIRTGKMLDKPFVFTMEDCGYPFYFCARSEEEQSEWVGMITEKISRSTAGGLPDVKNIPRATILSSAMTDYFGSVPIFGYLQMKTTDMLAWELRFVVLSGRELKLFSNADAAPQAARESLNLFTPEGSAVEIRNLMDHNFPEFMVANVDPSKPNTLFCAASNQERDNWLRALTSVDFKKDSNARTLARSSTAVSDGAPVSPRLGMHRIKSTKQLSEMSEALLMSMNLPKEKLCQEFVKFYQRCDCHGYLQRKRDFTGRWTREYYFMVGSQIYSFKHHQSRPERPQATMFTCTASGDPFPCKREVGISEKRKFTFSIRNWDRVWILAADTEADLNEWMEKIRMSVKPAQRNVPSTPQSPRKTIQSPRKP